MAKLMLKNLLRKKVIIPTAIVLAAGGFAAAKIAKPDIDPASIITEEVTKKDIAQTVLATGQVVSETDLGLSFKVNGFVRTVSAKVGAKVYAGQILALLDQRSELASLKRAQSALLEAKANYQKILEGARTEEVAVAEAAVAAAEVALENARQDRISGITEQQTLVDNAYRKLLNTDTSPIAITRYDTTATLTVTGTYSEAEEGLYRIKLQSTGLSQFYFQATGLENDSKPIIRGTPVALGTRGLYLVFGEAGDFLPIDEWEIRIPNKTSSSYVTYYNAYLAAIETQKTALSDADAAVASAQAVLGQRRADLELKKSAARSTEVDVAKARVLSAEAEVQEAQAALESTVIRAPAGGTVTSVDVKVGEQATALREVVMLQDVENLYLEANISEADIANLRVGQKVEVFFDALGSEKNYLGTLQFVDPASNSTSGIVNYKIKVGIGKLPEIKPGLTANMRIETGTRSAVFAIPQRAVLNRDGKKFVRVISDPAKKAFTEQEITTGLVADGGIVEVLSGLTEDQEIITTLPSK